MSRPFIRIFRPQRAGSVPQEDGVFDADQVLGNTDLVYGLQERVRRVGATADPDYHRFIVKHLPIGNQGGLRGRPICIAANVLGFYHLEIRAKNIWEPLAYWIQIDDESAILSVTARILAYVDRNVKLTNVLNTEKSVRLAVFRWFLASRNDRHIIPDFANNIRMSQGGWPRKYEGFIFPRNIQQISYERPDGHWWKQFVAPAENLVGIIPVVGDVYDIGAVAYMAVTGKEPWTGKRVSREAAMVYAAAAIGPISVSQLRRFSNFAKGLPSELAHLSDDVIQDGLERALSPDITLRMAAAATDERMRQLRNQLLEVGSKKMKAAIFAKEFSRILAEEADLSSLEKRFDAMLKYTRIGELFSSPVALREPLLSEYQGYLVRKKLTSADVPPLEWCRYQTSGRNAKALFEILGPNYAGHLRALSGSGLGTVRREQVEASANMLSRGGHVDNYSDLCRRTPGVSALLERDHIFERRFLYNNPDFSESFDIEPSTLAVLVPRDQAALDLIRTFDPRTPAEFTHAAKRPLMKRLPDGLEGEFPLQAIWDVHIDTFRQLGVKVTPNGKSFGANVFLELEYNLDHLADDLREQAKILTAKGEHQRAAFLRKKAEFRKRFDPKDRAFRAERFKNPEWWKRADS